MAEINAHEVLRMMEGNSYLAKSQLREAIINKFGEQNTFFTCSAKDLKVDALIDFLEQKGKFKPAGDGFTMDITKVCSSY